LSAARALALLALCAAAEGCLPTGDFRCERHGQCGAGAFCEVDGRCSAADPRCPSGRRYLDDEGDASNACVGASCAANPLVGIAAGVEHACAWRADGAVSCWGRNDQGQLGDSTNTPRARDVPVVGFPGAVSVAAGQRHTCAATAAGAVFCWGADDAGQLGDGGGPPRALPAAVAGITTAVAVTAGEAFSCAVLRDATAVCWGDNTLGQLGDGGDATPMRKPTQVFALDGIRVLSAGWQHACAVRDDESLWCWGDNSAGQLGDGSMVDQRPRPVEVQTLGAVTGVAAGLLHTCAATRAEGLFCWGDNGLGQLGDDSAGPQPLPAPVRLVPDPVAVAAGASHTCAIRQGGAILCWGANAHGQLGEGSTSTLPIPAVVTGLPAVIDVAAGGGYSCARDARGALFCWGDDHYGQLGVGRAVTRAQPVQVVGVSKAVAVAAGAGHTCVVSSAGGATKSVQCWGANQAGQLGDATTVDRASAAPVKGGFDAASVAAGMAHTCAVADGGALFCWGRGHDGQLGPRRLIDTNTPLDVPLARPALSVTAGDAHTCAVLDDGTAACWGSNADGQLGDGSMTDHSQPAPVKAGDGTTANLGPVERLSAGAGHTCAHLSAKTVSCWGRNADGQLGDGSKVSRLLPIGVSIGGVASGVGALAVSAGAAHTCALDDAGTVWCWGSGKDERLGLSDTNDLLAPSMPTSLFGMLTVAAGGAHTCAIGPEHGVLCWGANDQGQVGQVGQASLGPSSPPAMPVASLAGVGQLAAGAAHTCAIREEDGTVWCWGSNTSGQLGDGDALAQTKPQLSRLNCR
jgi:alpha-tubulin suppressor-like RCC1 family protein